MSSKNLDRYIFTFHEYDGRTKVVNLSVTLTTKPVTPKRAGELLNDYRRKRYTTKDKYVLSVQLKTSGCFVNPKELR